MFLLVGKRLTSVLHMVRKSSHMLEFGDFSACWTHENTLNSVLCFSYRRFSADRHETVMVLCEQVVNMETAGL